uniref:Uncharacterized protein n=1 Tax=Arundo donax TaxID=35708 RepID=A0A0A9BBQ8_ARUDO
MGLSSKSQVNHDPTYRSLVGTTPHQSLLLFSIK